MDTHLSNIKVSQHLPGTPKQSYHKYSGLGATPKHHLQAFRSLGLLLAAMPKVLRKRSPKLAPQRALNLLRLLLCPRVRGLGLAWGLVLGVHCHGFRVEGIVV